MRLINLNSLETFRKVVTASGTPQVLSPQYTSTTISFTFDSSSKDTISDSASQFLVQGFRAGDVITISGSTSNDSEYKIYSVTASTITLEVGRRLTTEAAAATVTIDNKHGREVPDGVNVLIKAMSSNTGTITVASTSARALNTNSSVYDSHFRLTKEQALSVNVKNLKSIWCDATVSGEGVLIGFEY